MTELQFDFLMSINTKQQIEMLRYKHPIADIVAMPEAVRISRVIYEIKRIGV